MLNEFLQILLFGLYATSIFFGCVYLVSKLSDWIYIFIARHSGSRLVRLFAMPGTIVHELSHLFVAICMGHTINKVVLFNPDPRSIMFGEVKTSYTKRGLYRIRNAMIGIAPIFIAPIFALILLMLNSSTQHCVLRVQQLEGLDAYLQPDIFRCVAYSLSDLFMHFYQLSPLVTVICAGLIALILVHSPPSYVDLRGNGLGILQLVICICAVICLVAQIPTDWFSFLELSSSINGHVLAEYVSIFFVYTGMLAVIGAMIATLLLGMFMLPLGILAKISRRRI